MKVHELHSIPDGLLTVPARDLHTLLPSFTLLHLPGGEPRPLFVSVLLHGDEDVGLMALQQWLRTLEGAALPRALCVLFGNVEAARRGMRYLDGEPDFNRVWPTGPASAEAPATPQHALALEAFLKVASLRPFAAIDLHNNTGRNPLYSCIDPSEPRARKLASLFSGIALATAGTIDGTLTSAMASLCPSITCECGRIGDADGIHRAAALIDRALRLTHGALDGVDDSRLETYATYATLQVPPSVSIGFDDSPGDIRIRSDIDLLNFLPLPAGFSLARARPGLGRPALQVVDENNQPLDDVLFVDNGEVRLRAPCIPAMLTPKEQAIRKTCLGYLMRRV